MTGKRFIYQVLVCLLLGFMQASGCALHAQNLSRAASKRAHKQPNDTVRPVRHTGILLADSIKLPTDQPDGPASTADSIAAENRRKMLEMTSPTTIKAPGTPTDSLHNVLARKQWIPNPTKATWLALVVPGGGQIYNRKYWKLPIFYGGFAGCAYALTWNGKMYKDYYNAYKDAMNGHMQSSSITDLLPPGYRISESQLKELLRKRKDLYRRYRDLSIFAFIGVYLLSVVDAYVDAELSNFDITPDLSMRVEPAVIHNNRITGSSGKSVGVQCSLRF